MSDIAALILAAGRSTRFAGDDREATKLAADLHGKPLIRHVADAALASRARPVIVVTGHAREAVAAALAGLPLGFAHNESYAAGLAGSLRTGIAQVPPDAAGAIVLLGDMPFVRADIIDELIRRYNDAESADAVVPIAGGRPGNPVLLGRSLFPALAELEGDEGARRLLQAPGLAIVEVPIAGEAASVDIDTSEGLDLWRQRGATR